MKLELFESGIQNINDIAKNYSKAKIFFHMDLDGICSAIAIKAYLEQYGIKTVECQKIQYGSMEYAVSKPSDSSTLNVLVDFAHGKPLMKIHTDHHMNQIKYNTASGQFAHSPSNANTISTIISPNSIFPSEDIRVINMIDSAGYAKENVDAKDLLRAVVKIDKNKDVKRNHLEFGMIVGKLLIAYKNKPNFFETIVMEAKPSLMSMYNVIMKELNYHIQQGDKGWKSPEEIEKNSQWYYDEQSKKSLSSASISDVESLTFGQNSLIGNTIIQVGGGNMSRTGSFDRYTAFRLYPDSKFFIMIWDSIGMMQISANPWIKNFDTSNVNLGELVMDKIFKEKYEPKLMNSKYDISLLAIKKEYESSITPEIEKSALGFDLNEFEQLFQKTFDLSDEYKDKLEKSMRLKPSRFKPTEDESLNARKMKMINFLNSLKLPLPLIIEKCSGGHKTITNVSGFNFLDQQKRIDSRLSKNINPYYVNPNPLPKPKTDESKPKFESTSVKIMKSMARDIIKELNEKYN